MTQSSTPSTPPTPTKSRQRRSAASGLHALLVLIFRLLLLGVGGSLAALAGIAIAQFYPARQTSEPPLVEKVMQGSQSVMTQIRQLPERWSGQPASKESPSPSAAPNTPNSTSQALPSPDANSPNAGNPNASSPDANSAERQQLQNELTQLQAELQTLTQKSSEPLEERVQAIQKRIQTIQERLNAFTAPKPPQETILVAPATSTAGNQLMVTLPSDALFGSDQQGLRSGSEGILNTIVADLQRYPKATIQVAAHTDNQGSAQSDRLRSYEQATAIKQYLSSKLGNDYRWITVGYGHSRPLADDSSPTNRQRNRRIEIVIQPAS